MKKTLLHFLQVVDDSFNPALSDREHFASPDQGPLPPARPNQRVPRLHKRLDLMLKHEGILIGHQHGELKAVLTFVPDKTFPELGMNQPFTFANISAVHPAERDAGLGGQLYLAAACLGPAERNELVGMSTWSTNLPQIHLATRFGLEEVGRSVDERGPGVDGLYFLGNVPYPERPIHITAPPDLSLSVAGVPGVEFAAER